MAPAPVFAHGRPREAADSATPGHVAFPFLLFWISVVFSPILTAHQKKNPRPSVKDARVLPSPVMTKKKKRREKKRVGVKDEGVKRESILKGEIIHGE